MNLLTAHRHHRQLQQAVVQQQGVAGLHVARQFFVIQADAFVGAQLRRAAVEHECLTHFQHRLAAFEFADANFWALQVGHDRNLFALSPRHIAHHGGAVDVVLRCAVREVQPHHVHTGANHASQDFRRAGRRA